MKEALKLALDALKNGKRVRNAEGGTQYQPDLEDEAIKALEEALTKPEQWETVPHCEAGPNYCWKCLEEAKPTYGSEEIRKLREVIKNYTTPPQRTWVGLKEEDFVLVNQLCTNPIDAAEFVDRLLKARNQ